MKIHYEITYTLPNSDGGHRADAREYSVPEIGDDGVPSDEWYEAVAAEQEWLDEYVKWLRAYGATHIRLSDPSGTLDLR